MKLLNDVSVLVAVGLNGDAVVFSILEGGKGMMEKMASQSAQAAFAPLELPVAPGLYWFAGRSRGNPSPRTRTTDETLIDGEFTLLTDPAG